MPLSLEHLAPASPTVLDPAIVARLAGLRWDQVGSPYDIYLEPTPDCGLPAGRYPMGDMPALAARDGTTVLAHAVAGDDGARLMPALFMMKHGAGCVAWFPATLELTWAQGAGLYRPLARLVASVIDRLSERPRPYRLEAPRGIFSNLMAGSGGILLHLVDEQPDRDKVRINLEMPTVPGARLSDAITGEVLPTEHTSGAIRLVGHHLSRYACLLLRTNTTQPTL
jgi:hypothetical protein